MLINWFTVIAQIVNFLVLVYLLRPMTAEDLRAAIGLQVSQYIEW